MELLIAPFLISGLALKLYNNSKKKLLNKKSSKQNLLYSNFLTHSFTTGKHTCTASNRKDKNLLNS